MKARQVILKAMSGELSWPPASDILGVSPRAIRWFRERYETGGYDGLLDRRRRSPTPVRPAPREVEEVLRLYRGSDPGTDLHAFHRIARKHHRITLPYPCVVALVREAGLQATAVQRSDAR